MPSNIFAATGTNVSILFLDDNNDGKVILIDASGLGKKVKEGKNQKTLLSDDDEQRIIDTFHARETVQDFSAAVSYGEIEAKNCSLSAGQYFEVKIEYSGLSEKDFEKRLSEYQFRLKTLFGESRYVEAEIEAQLERLSYEK